jgi:energy-coupling factor transporter ATP-binding protein EcfA2
MLLLGAVISDWKSIEQAEVPLHGLTVLAGPNGAGKSNIIEALAAYDPAAKPKLSRLASSDTARPRVGFVVRVDVDMAGAGSDAPHLQSILWSIWEDPDVDTYDITSNRGAYCGDVWWREGDGLRDPATRADLAVSLRQVTKDLLGGVNPAHRGAATELIELLWNEPTLLVQEDFSVDLSCDRTTPAGRAAKELATQLSGLVGEGPMSSIVGVLTSWTGRWPPLLTIGVGGLDSLSDRASGFSWAAERFGGVQLVTIEDVDLESRLQPTLEVLHDRMNHQDDYEVYDCENCIRSDHGGRADPESSYKNLAPPGADTDHLPTWKSRDRWLKTSADGGWVRVRRSVVNAAETLQDLINTILPRFVARTGSVELKVLAPQDWKESIRISVRFRLHVDDDAGVLLADWGGPVGVQGFTTPRRYQPPSFELRDLGDGVRRWIGVAASLAADLVSGLNDGSVLEPGEWVAAGSSGFPHLILIDEPEQHLHVTAQADVAAWCLEQSRNNQAVVVATHSPEFLSLSPERASVCHVYQKNGVTQIRTMSTVHGGPQVVERARELGVELGLGGRALAYLTRGAVVVEGEWDRRVLEKLFGPELAEQGILVVPLQGSDEAASLVDLTALPALDIPVAVMFDNVRSINFDRAGPLSKEERGLRDLKNQVGSKMIFVPYTDPDIICGLPVEAVHRAFPHAQIVDWSDLLTRWEALNPGIPFKHWATKEMGLSSSQRQPTRFFTEVLAQCRPEDRPGPNLTQSVKLLLAELSQAADQRP